MALFIVFIIFVLVIIIINKEHTSTKKSVSQPKAPNLHGKRCFDTSTQGEGELLHLLENALNTKDYYIFNDLIIPNGSGSTTEIDHVVISNHGIFVIENKDYTGWLFGTSKQKKWTQVFKGGKKYHFQNPLHQNYGHLKSLQKVLHFVDEKRFYPIVAFSRRAEFKTEIPNDVFYYDQIPEVIQSIQDVQIEMNRVLLAIGRLSHLCQLPSSNRENHINNVEGKISK